MPRKIRELIRDLKSWGFTDRGGKGSHRNFFHPDCPYPATISGKEGDDAKRYQEKALRLAKKEIQNAPEKK
ncbi:MAG TPA: type II toxin-antitoxin system HicA family toxin [bacterium]|nr:type II toxin-antitoxin system HicA family toxin [bacterium]